MANDKIRAIALLSGGLDSTLSALLMKKHGIDVKGIVFITPFSTSNADLEKFCETKKVYYESLGIDVDVYKIVDEYIEMVKNPPHGYGKNMNPCIDCKILFLKKAKDLLSKYQAKFIITGEVLNQRPMSQMLNALLHIEKEAGVEGLVVRPLSGRLLPPTKPELEGIISREWLLAIKGRGRKEQLELAKELGLHSFQQPSGGCLLTVPSFSERLQKALVRNEFDPLHITLLKLGRHFFVKGIRLTVGRNEAENQELVALASGRFTIVEPVNTKGPIAVFDGHLSDESTLKTVVGIVARYCDKKENVEFVVNLTDGKTHRVWVEKAFDPSEVDKFRD